ncbi:MAG: FMN-binding glutamate synthase family protein [Acidobacteria bacterium]|nr:FMN-binding glutamate synthase family protein [Acidobacteriota bacterium]MCB9396343.1 FMN-binding glutamate synthase family protein [Acidobacteriota bacterium]
MVAWLSGWNWLWLIPIGLLLVALYDIFQKKHTILHNFPIVGHLRYWLETIGPELRQYWVANDKEELPFNRSERAWVYASSKGQNNTFGFGTSEQIYGTGYPIIKNAVFPYPEVKAIAKNGHSDEIASLKVMGEIHNRAKPFRPTSVINISAMSFGSLGANAVQALNLGAKLGHCYHNTGEGGISKYHLQGGDLVYQLGTGYFGSRDDQGKFHLDMLVSLVGRCEQVKAIEVKLSQGAKPGKGGILPGRKVTAEIAHARKVPAYKDCISPNAHAEFDTVDELIDFVERIASATGLPVGIKSAVGKMDFWYELARRMRERQAGPDYIAIDGGEGGTGAAPLTFADHVSLPFKIGFARVYKAFQDEKMASRVMWIGAGKLGFPDRAVIAFAMGCDLIYVAREAMLAIGCIQAQKCHTDHCPAGVATQNKWLQAGLNPEDKAQRMARYLKSFRKELLSLAHAAGYEHPQQFTGRDIEFCTGVNQFSELREVMGYERDTIFL